MDRLQASEWLQIAETELDRAARFLDQGDAFAAYCLNQAIEAGLFAFLLHSGEELEADVEYELEDLLGRASNKDREVKARGDAMRSVAHLSDLVRHPGRQPEGQTLKHTLRAIEAACHSTRQFVNYVRRALYAEGE